MCCIYDLAALFIFCNNLSDVTGFFLGAVTYHYVVGMSRPSRELVEESILDVKGSMKFPFPYLGESIMLNTSFQSQQCATGDAS